MQRRKIVRTPVLDVEGLRELLHLTKHEVRALVENNDDGDFPFGLSNYSPHVAGRPPLSADKEAR